VSAGFNAGLRELLHKRLFRALQRVSFLEEFTQQAARRRVGRRPARDQHQPDCDHEPAPAVKACVHITDSDPELSRMPAVSTSGPEASRTTLSTEDIREGLLSESGLST